MRVSDGHAFDKQEQDRGGNSMIPISIIASTGSGGVVCNEGQIARFSLCQ